MLNLAKEKNLIADEDIKQLKNEVEEKLQWHKERLRPFEKEFFTGKCEGNAASMLGTIPIVTLN